MAKDLKNNAKLGYLGDMCLTAREIRDPIGDNGCGHG